jgi:molybdenum cofactor biosynthesis protein B
MASQSTQEHRAAAAQQPPVRVAVFTISDTRTPETDTSGALIVELLREAGHEVVVHAILPDEPTLIRHRLLGEVLADRTQVILTNGGTGIAPRDGTFEAVCSLIDKPLPGFGELFRMLSWQEVGPAAMLSRAVAGLAGGTFIFTMPGSRNAVEVAMRRLILPEISHLVWETKR